MKFHQIFRASLHEPRKLAAFRLLSIGKVFSSVFVFVTFFTLISILRFSGNDGTLFADSPELKQPGETIGRPTVPQ